MKFGYCRVSTQEQNFNSQIDAITQVGVDERHIYKEKITGVKKDRPELTKLLNQLQSGDTIIVFKLDRLGRSLKHLISLVEDLNKKEVTLVSIRDNIDTSTPTGKLTFNIFASLAEFERDLIRERTKAGLESARARGRVGGRPKGLKPEAIQKAKMCESLYNSGDYSIIQITEQLGISKPTLYKYLKYQKSLVNK